MAKQRSSGTNRKNPCVIQLSYENPLLGLPALNDAVIQAMGEQELFELVSFGQVTSGRWAGYTFGGLPMPAMRRFLNALLRGEGIDVQLIHRRPASPMPNSHLFLKSGRLIGAAECSRDNALAENRRPANDQHGLATTPSARRPPLDIGKPPADPRPAQPRFAPGERSVYARLLWLAALSLFLERLAEPLAIANGPKCVRVTMAPLSFLYTADVGPWGTKSQSLLDVYHDDLGKVLSICSSPLGPPTSWRTSTENMFSFYADPVEIVCFKPGAWMELLLQRQTARPS